jgi:hypothetical protein
LDGREQLLVVMLQMQVCACIEWALVLCVHVGVGLCAYLLMLVLR